MILLPSVKRVLTFCRILQDTRAHNERQGVAGMLVARGYADPDPASREPVFRPPPDDKIGNRRRHFRPSARPENAMSVLATSRKPSATPQTGRDARLAARAGTFKGQTAGVAPGYVQGNLAILPANLAGDFLPFCQLNPKPCLLLATSAPSDFRLPTLADDLDIRTDLPRYRVFRDGDLVAFVLGCSFSFEEALVEDGIELRHITCNATVPMYRTSVATAPAGPFHGPMVVSMRPMKPADAIRAIQITTRFPAVHGAPVHIGKP